MDFLVESLKGAIKPTVLNLADVTLLHEIGRKDNKENYKLVNILLALSKIL